MYIQPKGKYNVEFIAESAQHSSYDLKEEMIGYQDKLITELKKLMNAKLIEICKAYFKSYSGKNKNALVNAVES